MIDRKDDKPLWPYLVFATGLVTLLVPWSALLGWMEAHDKLAAWVQAVGAIAAIIGAFLVPWHSERRAHVRARMGHLEAVATDLLITERQARVYLDVTQPRMPAYRMPLYGSRFALPALLAEGTRTGVLAGPLVQYYVDATSFNMLLDEAREQHHSGYLENKKAALETAFVKAGHLVRGTPGSRCDDAIAALRQAGLPDESLQPLPLDFKPLLQQT